MKGKIGGKGYKQVEIVFSKIFAPNRSKHNAKLKAIQHGAVTKSDIAKSTEIYSYKVLKDYSKVALDLYNFAKEGFGIKSIELLTNEIVSEFLKDKIESGVSKGSLNAYSSAIGKLEVALNKYRAGNAFDFSAAIKEAKASFAGDKSKYINRGFTNPENVINNMKCENNKLVAGLQLEYGLRVQEAGYIKLDKQLHGNTLSVRGKGGYNIKKELSAGYVEKLKGLADENNLFKVEYRTYLNDIKQAAEVVNETYSGSHSFRYNFAQNMYNELVTNQKMTDKAACLRVSREMGHHREDITRHYLC